VDQASLRKFFITRDAKVRDALACIDCSGRISLALLVDDQESLITVLSDGDIRRGILHGMGLDACVLDLLPLKATLPNPEPVTASAGTSEAALLKLMQTKGVRQVPLLDSNRHVVDIVLLRDLLPDDDTDTNLQAVIMAGGFGTRLKPLTDKIPKPMLPVAGRPLMERLVEQLQHAGIRRVNVTTHYKPEKIVEHFGDGSAFGVEITYVNEETPLGTGGALSLMSTPDTPVLVVNGDVLSGIDFRKMLEYHQDHRADMTVAVTSHIIKVPYGVVDQGEGAKILGVREKPEVVLFVNAGIYLLEPFTYQLVPKGTHFNMTDLVERLIADGRNVISYPIREYWLDIGQRADYEHAQELLKEADSVA
jgi:dTDP-glucose pyrophosphorylase/CBS domain-containing protein